MKTHWGETGRFVDRCCGMPGALEIMTQTVDKNDFRNFMLNHSNVYVSAGKVFKIKGEDIAGNLIELSARYV